MEVADTFLKQLLGLMFRKDGEMLFVFNRDIQQSVWTPFMNFNIDIFFFDKDLNLVGKKKNMKPWRIYFPKKKYKYFFESKAGKYKKEEVLRKINDKV